MKNTIERQAWILHTARGKTFKEISVILNMGNANLASIAAKIYQDNMNKEKP